jgi:hypothetical protein
MNLSKYIFFFGFLCVTGCQIQGNLKGLTSYRNEVEPHMELLSSQEAFSCELSYQSNQRFSITNGLQLRDCISLNDRVLLYLWRPNCPSPICLDLNLLQAECKRMNITLYVVAKYYDLKQFSIKYNLEKPIIGIDTDYYKTNFTSRYVKRFFRDVVDSARSSKSNSYFYYFESGNFLKESRTFDEIISSILLN